MERYTKEKTFAIIDEKLKSIREKFQKDQQMDMAEFYDLFTRSNELIHVVDCRSQEEFDECHISGAYTLADYYGHTEWRGLPIRAFFYSRIGERSAAAVEEALKQGIKAYNVNGGLIEWLHYNGYCDFKDDGEEKRVNVVDKEFAPMVPEGMTPVFRED
ncbi:ribonuclease P subunit Rpp30 [Blastocystis sp. ATCC 50177/Nand II]|uniref:Ribonuclease P subunit Rpp30 n=1 Tax=Blastocystis sp. subtype 1 (strain ATCC 50177 / NandII) TaxID=478820 RepID=A0A196SPK0_BLAHN|nr:ribonuclease P subunit Rpp30 [Blastocystis sp. ATCC 50177/Nand II]